MRSESNKDTPQQSAEAGQKSQYQPKYEKKQQKQQKKGQQQQQVASDSKPSTGGRQGSTPQPPRLALFDHLPKVRTAGKNTTMEGSSSIHPAIIKLGELFLSEIIHDDDDRAQALLIAFCNVIEDYKTPPHTSLSWDLDKHIKLQVRLLTVFDSSTSIVIFFIVYICFSFLTFCALLYTYVHTGSTFGV